MLEMFEGSKMFIGFEEFKKFEGFRSLNISNISLRPFGRLRAAQLWERLFS